MADHRPPVLAADERATLVTSWQFQRDSLLRCVEGVDDEAAARPQVPSGTSLRWLVGHCRFAERVWVEARFAGRDVDLEDLPEEASLAEAVAAYRATWADVDAIVAAADLDDEPATPVRGDEVNLRWIAVHLVEELARHAGHADILRELLDGETGR